MKSGCPDGGTGAERYQPDRPATEIPGSAASRATAQRQVSIGARPPGPGKFAPSATKIVQCCI